MRCTAIASQKRRASILSLLNFFFFFYSVVINFNLLFIFTGNTETWLLNNIVTTYRGGYGRAPNILLTVWVFLCADYLVCRYCSALAYKILILCMTLCVRSWQSPILALPWIREVTIMPLWADTRTKVQGSKRREVRWPCSILTSIYLYFESWNRIHTKYHQTLNFSMSSTKKKSIKSI